MLKIQFTTCNAAFDNADKGITESTRLLKKIITDLESGYCEGNILDANGNSVGNWSYEYDGYPELPTEVMYDSDQFHSHYDDELYEEIGDKLTEDYGYTVRGYTVDPQYLDLDGEEFLTGYLVTDIDWDI